MQTEQGGRQVRYGVIAKIHRIVPNTNTLVLTPFTHSWGSFDAQIGKIFFGIYP